MSASFPTSRVPLLKTLCLQLPMYSVVDVTRRLSPSLSTLDPPPFFLRCIAPRRSPPHETCHVQLPPTRRVTAAFFFPRCGCVSASTSSSSYALLLFQLSPLLALKWLPALPPPCSFFSSCGLSDSHASHLATFPRSHKPRKKKHMFHHGHMRLNAGVCSSLSTYMYACMCVYVCVCACVPRERESARGETQTREKQLSDAPPLPCPFSFSPSPSLPLLSRFHGCGYHTAALPAAGM